MSASTLAEMDLGEDKGQMEFVGLEPFHEVDVEIRTPSGTFDLHNCGELRHVAATASGSSPAGVDSRVALGTPDVREHSNNHLLGYPGSFCRRRSIRGPRGRGDSLFRRFQLLAGLKRPALGAADIRQ
jgi:hypothetical protein